MSMARHQELHPLLATVREEGHEFDLVVIDDQLGADGLVVGSVKVEVVVVVGDWVVKMFAALMEEEAVVLRSEQGRVDWVWKGEA